jgi:hypothetical protein
LFVFVFRNGHYYDTYFLYPSRDAISPTTVHNHESHV